MMLLARRAGALALLLTAACAGDRRPADTPADSTVSPPAGTSRSADEWPDRGPIDVRRARSHDLTGDGVDERIRITARGAGYDSLRLGLAILSARGDTLWFEQWDSAHYFKYESMADQPDSVRADVVKGHVDALLADDRFSAAGLPTALRRGDPASTMKEAVRYHLAELDWRNRADLQPADPLPPQAYTRIRVADVATERVDVVVAELRGRPAFMYYAGGEATYAIAWSARENAFVRIYACC